MSLSVVQSIGKAAGSGNCTFTLTSTPTVGNGLLAFVFYNDGYVISPPSGYEWIQLATTPPGGNGGARLDVWWRIIQSGDGKTWTFPVTGDLTSGQLYEITGANNQYPMSGLAWAGAGSGVASIVSPSATPAVASSLAFAAETDNNGTGISSVTSGWTLLADTGTFHGGGSAYNPTLTSSAATCTFTMSGTTGGYADVTILIAPAAASTATLYPVQDAVHLSATGNIVLALNVTPATGNLMVAFVAWKGMQTLTPPSGWTQIFSVNNGIPDDSLAAFYRVVQAGDSNSYTWTISGDYGSGELFEITGASTTSPVNGYQTATDTGTPTSRTSPSVTPNVLGCLPLAAETSDGSGDRLGALSAGWTPADSHKTYHGSSAGYGPLTTDTSTGITCTFTYTAAAGAGADATVLIAPAPQVSAPAPPAATPGRAWQRVFQPWRRADAQRAGAATAVTTSGSLAMAPMALSGSGVVSWPVSLPAQPGRSWQRRFQPWRKAVQGQQQPAAVITVSGTVALAPMAVAGTAVVSLPAQPPAAPGPAWRRVFQPWRKAVQGQQQPARVTTVSGAPAMAPMGMSGTVTISSLIAPAAATPSRTWQRQFQPWRRAEQGQDPGPPPPASSNQGGFLIFFP